MKYSYKVLKSKEIETLNAFFSFNPDNFNLKSRISNLLEFIPFIKLPSSPSNLQEIFWVLLKKVNFIPTNEEDSKAQEVKNDIPENLEELVREIEKIIIENTIQDMQLTDEYLENLFVRTKDSYSIIPSLFVQLKVALNEFLNDSICDPRGLSSVDRLWECAEKFFKRFLAVSDCLFLRNFMKWNFNELDLTQGFIQNAEFVEYVSVVFKDAKNYRFFMKASLNYTKFKPFLIKNSDRKRFFNLKLTLTHSRISLSDFEHGKVYNEYYISPEGILESNEIPRGVSGFVTIGSNLNCDIILHESVQTSSNLNAVIIWKNYNYHIIDLTRGFSVSKKLKHNKFYPLTAETVVVLCTDHTIRVKKIENEIKEDPNSPLNKKILSKLTFEFITGRYSFPIDGSKSEYIFETSNKTSVNNQMIFTIGKGGQESPADFLISFDPKISRKQLCVIFNDETKQWSLFDFDSKNGNWITLNSFIEFSSKRTRRPHQILSDFEVSSENWNDFETIRIREFTFFISPTSYNN